MGDNSMFLMLIFGIGLTVVFFLVASNLDDERIRRYLSSRGEQLLEKTWEPFGPGWFGEKNDRIYRIVYLDSGGNTHQAYAKTSLFAGTYLRDDQIIRGASRHENPPAASDVARLQEENSRLREELARLKDRPS